MSIIGIFTKHYWKTLHHAAPIMDKIADLIPRRRDRLIRKNFFSYMTTTLISSIIASVIRVRMEGSEIREESKL